MADREVQVTGSVEVGGRERRRVLPGRGAQRRRRGVREPVLVASRERLHDKQPARHVRLRKRVDNQERLYASVRAELEVKKDRLRTQEEQIQRLEALKVAVAD